MIESIEFTNFKALRTTSVPLAPFSLLLGPNGSGKTTVLQALQAVAALAAQHAHVQRPPQPERQLAWSSLRSVTADAGAFVEIKLRLRFKTQPILASFKWDSTDQRPTPYLTDESGAGLQPNDAALPLQWLARMQVFALDPSAIAQAHPVNSGPLQANGAGLAAVLDDLKDNHPERWHALLQEMCRWLPEYDHILFDKPQAGLKSIVLRTKKGGHRIPAGELSQGTLVALALLTLAYGPAPPSAVGLEEIDRGLHPRLLRHLQDALYRLSYPENYREKRPAIQVVATTHSPYLLDLYRDHPEEVILAQKKGLEVTMERLTDIEHYQEIVGAAPLSDVWYSGVLGGVSVKP